jgi:hypothetical protein
MSPAVGDQELAGLFDFVSPQVSNFHGALPRWSVTEQRPVPVPGPCLSQVLTKIDLDRVVDLS